ncbi:MAG TPA: universal stress protein [Gaiellaceae bacterium]|jgi:nucleotide-binding universal stress UspA family protein|nr:universal stress protein [Gaiellaceae bacterium]
MSAKIIVSYDGTAADDDALAFGRMLSKAGASLALAYVRHTDRLGEADAQALLETGARWLGQPDVPRHVVLSGSTPEGLRDLAAREQADLIVFGSEYRTTPGHVDPGTSARTLLDDGPVSLAIAPADMRYMADAPVGIVAAVDGDGDPSATTTAAALANEFGAAIATKYTSAVGLVVLGSKLGTPDNTVRLSAAAQYLIDLVRCPVIVLARGVAIPFGT